MSDSDKDTSAAIDKVVGAFRAQREQGKTVAPAADTPADDAAAADDAAVAPASDAPEQREPTPITKLDDSVPTPQGGGGSEAPTKAFKIPTEVAAAAAATTTTDGPESTDDATSDDAASATGLREESVVGEPISAEPSPVATPDAPAAEKAGLVEQSIALSAEESPADGSDDNQPAADATPTKTISSSEVAAATAQAEPASDDAPTTKMKVPAAAAAAAAAGTAAAATTANRAPEPAPASKPEPQVVAPADPDRKKRKTGKLVAVLLAVVVVIAVVAVGLWYLLVGSSDQSQVADAAQSYQNAMASGDLDKLRSLTCGEKYAYYSNVSPEEFQKAFDAQKARNELMTFDEVNAVQIDGDLARVGVDMYPSSDPSKTAPAQITLHKVDGEWKVCTKP